MAEKTAIAWTRSTRNFWSGCTKVSPGCDNCYAEAFNRFTRGKNDATGQATNWGPGSPRIEHLVNADRDVRKWDNACRRERTMMGQKHVVTPRDGWIRPGFWPVFINSNSDTFDNEVPQLWRDLLFTTIEDCEALTFFLVTKRISNVPSMVKERGWLRDGFPKNVRLLITVVNPQEADRDIPKVLALPVKNGLSMEPLLSYIDLSHWLIGDRHDEIGNGVSIAARNRRVFSGQERYDLEASQAHSRKSYRNTTLLEGDPASASGALEIGRLPDGNVFGRREAAQSFCSQNRLDGTQSGGYSAGHGSEPRERQAGRLNSDQPNVDDAIPERDPRYPSVRPETEGPTGREESLGATHRSAGIGYSQVERKDSAIATRGDVRRDTGNNLGRRDSQNLEKRGIGWVIIGGESGRKARPFDLSWARSTVAQCKAAGVPVFVKQLGSNTVRETIHHDYGRFNFKDRAGADPTEWPEDLRVREFPE